MASNGLVGPQTFIEAGWKRSGSEIDKSITDYNELQYEQM